MEITLLLLVFRLTLFLSTGIILEITLLDLVFRLTTPRSVCKWRSHFWMWFSDSPHHHIPSADIIMEITLLELVFRLTTSCLQEYGDQPFGHGFQTRHITLCEQNKINGNHTSVLDLQTRHIFVLWANGDYNFGLGFPTHYVTFCGQMEITVLDLVFRLTTSRSVDKWRSQFQTWFSDSLRFVLWANEDHNFGLDFHRYTA